MKLLPTLQKKKKKKTSRNIIAVTKMINWLKLFFFFSFNNFVMWFCHFYIYILQNVKLQWNRSSNWSFLPYCNVHQSATDYWNYVGCWLDVEMWLMHSKNGVRWMWVCIGGFKWTKHWRSLTYVTRKKSIELWIFRIKIARCKIKRWIIHNEIFISYWL